MPKIFGRKRETEFDDAINRILFTMNEEEVHSQEYSKALVFLDRLTDIRNKDRSSGISRDTLVMAGTNLLGIALIVFAEQHTVVVSKALSLILKPNTRGITT